MKITKKVLALFVVMAMITVAFAGCNGTTTSTKTPPTSAPKAKLIVGTNPEFPPFEYLNDAGAIDGFDMALMKEVATRINMDVSIESMEFKGLIGALDSGKINAIAAGMTITEERKGQCDFSNPYVQSVQVVLTKKGSAIATAENLTGKTIAVQEGTTGDFIATDDVKGSTVTRFKKYLDAITEMINGKADAVIIDSSPAKSFLAQYVDKIVQVPNLEMANEEYGIAVKKGDTALLAKINDALKKMKADGTFDKIYKQYIG